MNTGNLKIIPDLLHHVSKNDENSYIPVTFLKNAGRTGGKLRPQDKNITRLQEPPLVNNTYFGAIHYDNHLDMKLDYTINTNFQELSLSELETLHHLCELERTQILQSLALAVLTIPYAGYLLSGNRSNFINYKGNILWYYICTKKVSPLYVFEDKRCYKRISIFYKNKVHFVDTLSRRTYFWDTSVPCGSEKSHNAVQYSEILVEYEKGFDMNTGNLKIIPDLLHHVSKNDDNSYIPVTFLKNAGRTGGKLRPQDKNITRLQEPSFINNTYFGAIHYDNHLDMKLDSTINTNFQEMSLSELETLHYLCELERTQILQSLALAVLTIPYAGHLLSGNRSNFINYEGNILWYYICTKKVSPLYVFEDKRCYKRIPIFYKNKVHFVDTLSRRTYFWDTAVPCGSEKSHNAVQLNPDEDKYYLLTPYPTLMPSLKKFSPVSIKAIARNPNIDLQSIGIYSRSDIQHHIRTQQYQELLTKMDTIQRQSIDQNLRKLAKTPGFSDIYTQDYSEYFKDIKDYIYLNGEKYRPQDISPSISSVL